MTELEYQAVLTVIGEGRGISEVAAQWRVSRRTMHRWLARYEAEGLEGLNERTHRPASCPHQMAGEVEVMVLELRRAHRYWGARRIALELFKKRVEPRPSESSVYRCLVRAGVIDQAVGFRNVITRLLPPDGSEIASLQVALTC